MSATTNVHNIKYFAPIAISRLYEKQALFLNNKPMSMQQYMEQPHMKQRRIQSEKQFEKMQKMMFAKSKENGWQAYNAPTRSQQAQTQTQQTQTQSPQKELQ